MEPRNHLERSCWVVLHNCPVVDHNRRVEVVRRRTDREAGRGYTGHVAGELRSLAVAEEGRLDSTVQVGVREAAGCSLGSLADLARKAVEGADSRLVGILEI